MNLWSDLCGGQNEGCETEIVGTCEEECTDAPLKRCERLV